MQGELLALPLLLMLHLELPYYSMGQMLFKEMVLGKLLPLLLTLLLQMVAQMLLLVLDMLLDLLMYMLYR